MLFNPLWYCPRSQSQPLLLLCKRGKPQQTQFPQVPMASIFCPFAILQAFHCCISSGSIAIGLLKPASKMIFGWNVNGNVANRKPGPPGKCHLMPNCSGDIKKNTPKMGGYDWFIKEDRHNQQPQESFCAMLRQLPTSLQKLDLAIGVLCRVSKAIPASRQRCKSCGSKR